MSCLLTNGYSLGCKDNTGGIQKFFIGNFSAATSFSYDADGVITGGTSVPTLYTFEQRNEVGEFTQEGQHSVENGTNFWNQTAVLTLYKYQASIRKIPYGYVMLINSHPHTPNRVAYPNYKHTLKLLLLS